MAIFATHKETKFQVGDQVRLHLLTHDGARRGSVVDGQVLGIKGEGENKSILVRKVGAAGIGVEYILPLASPTLESIAVRKSQGEGVRQAKLYYLRGKPKIVMEKIARRAAGKGKIAKATKSKKLRKPTKKRKVAKRK